MKKKGKPPLNTGILPNPHGTTTKFYCDMWISSCVVLEN
jgi:hypothetical protein